MNDEVNKPPPPGPTLLAAAAGGFIGAIAGAVVATNMMGEPDSAKLQEPEAQEQALVASTEE